MKLPNQSIFRYVIQSTMAWNSNRQIDPDKMEKIMIVMKNIQV